MIVGIDHVQLAMPPAAASATTIRSQAVPASSSTIRSATGSS
jgi:hypothetical protein